MIRILPAFACAISLPLIAAEPVDFNQDVRPILSDKCFKCHGPDARNQKSKFRIDSFENATADLDGVKGVVPGNLEESEVHWRIRSDDADELMPPPKSKMSLSEREKDIIDRWIEQGGTFADHWSFIDLPDSVEVPRTGDEWARNEIDRFIFAKQREKNLRPSPETIREKWIRRVTFDLTGLPPTLEEIDGFLSDHSPKAYEKVVDRLLDSDACAERLTTEWLDVARYSDTYGFQVDRNREVWPWRDWVIQAFRENLPYDQFITWQVAGDLLPNATRDQILATAFNRLHGQKVEGGSVPEEFRIEYVTDRVHTFGTAFLGLTMECTRCHDHKYDPLTQRDYFSLSAFFANIDEAGLYSYFTPSVPTPTLELPTGQQEKDLAATLKAVADLEAAKPELPAKIDPVSVEIPKTGQIVHLDFEALEKNRLKNLADEKNAASTNTNNQIVAGKIGNGMKLTGDDAVNLPKGIGNFTRDQPFSFALWIQTPDVKERAVIVRRSKAWTDAASRGYELLIEDGKLSAALIHFYPGNAIRVRATEKTPVGEWQHVAVVYDGSSRAKGLRIFVNGMPSKTENVRDKLSREIMGGGDDFVGLGQRMRDKGFKNGLVDEFYVYDRQLSAREVEKIANPDKKVVSDSEHHFLTKNEPAEKWRQELLAARKKRSGIQKSIKEIMVMREEPGERHAYILERGHYENRGEKVGPATPEKLPPMKTDPKNPSRLDLANWLIDPQHPLTARVTVNRYWQMMFGRGLVSTSEDFGSQGKPPSHPELLDWLARDFVNSGWDLRHLLKKMALSATYRQISNVSSDLRNRDPENIFLARSPSDGLSAEMLRDSALAISGLLSRKIGGPSVKPYDLAVSFKPIAPDKGEGLYRRSVYTFWKRTGPSPVMMTLDASKRDVCRVKRERTTSPLQGLVLLNGPQFVEAARETARKLIEKHGDDDAAILQECFRLLTSRKPDDREVEILQSLLSEQVAEFSANPDKAAKFFTVGERKPPSPPENPARLAAVTVLVSALINFDEAITKR
ncbi:MAG: DUF1553 domain-containing protein [Verrucomicrobiales bacterium]|nr:DUF1553 domain-containing protein [Verrucomicrobiales bacterium]